MKSRRLVSLVAATATAVAATMVPSAPASAQGNSRPQILSDSKVNIVKGGEAWISVNWTAPTEMQNFRMILSERSNGVEISYATGRTSAGLLDDATLSAGEIDTTSFLLSTSETAPSSFSLDVVAEWEFEGATQRFDAGRLTVRAENYKGEDFAVLTDAVSVSSIGDGSANWVEIDFLGLGPLTEGIRLEVEGELLPYYPQGTYTSLHHDDRLHGNETDVARVWFDPATIEPGTYDMRLVVSYLDAKSDQGRSETLPFVLTVS